MLLSASRVCANFSLVLTPIPTSEVCISLARCFDRLKESKDSLVRLVFAFNRA